MLIGLCRLRRVAAPLVLGLLGMGLPACKSPAKKDPLAPGRLDSITRPDEKKVSQYEKSFDTAAMGDRGAMKLMGKKSYSTQDYKGNTVFKGKDKSFHTSDFAQAGKTSREQKHMSPMADKMSKESGQVFKTKDSRFSGKKTKDGTLAFRQAGQQYKTNDFEPGKKSLEENKRPFFQPAGELDQKKTAYSEADVKALLNRN